MAAFITMALFGEFLVSLINEDPLVVAAASTYLLIVPIGIGLFGVMVTATACFNALGKPMPALIIAINQMLVVYVPLALIGNELFGYAGIFMALAATNMLLGVISWFWIGRAVAVREKHSTSMS